MPSKKPTGRKQQAQQALLAPCFMLVSYLVYSSILKMEAIFSSKNVGNFHLTTRRSTNISDDGTPLSHRCENLKSSDYLVI
jgi:hypothetical protein